MTSFELTVALRYVRARRKQTFISLISLLSMVGVALGAAALIVVTSVMSGFEGELRSKILGQNAHVALFEMGRPMSNWEKVAQVSQKDSGVQAAMPFVFGQVMIVSRGEASGGILRGIKLPESLKYNEMRQNLTQGDVDDLVNRKPNQLPGVILGSALAKRLWVKPGAKVNLINPLGQDTPVGRIPKSQPFEVVGIFESGMYQFDSTMCYVSLSAAQDFLELGSLVTGVELKIKDVFEADVLGKRVAKELGPHYMAQDWISTNASLFAALKLEKMAMFVVLTLIVLVAAFGIVSSLIMMVMEKTKDIGILKAMGATRSSIRRIFVLQGALIGVCGTVLGCAGGLFICWLLKRYKFIELPSNVYPMTSIPVSVDPWLVVLVSGCAMAISLAATLYPARHAGSLNPVEALRYE
jgi:lipoprotein-releasing system permease protein